MSVCQLAGLLCVPHQYKGCFKTVREQILIFTEMFLPNFINDAHFLYIEKLKSYNKTRMTTSNKAKINNQTKGQTDIERKKI